MRVAILGMGAIGQRLATALAAQPDMTLSGVAVRSSSPGVLARPELPYYASTATAADALASSGIHARGELDELLGSSDVIVDCGQAGTGTERASTYRRASIRTIYCGGERSSDLGPLVNSSLNYHLASGVDALRLLSCNTTALARVASCLRDDLTAVDATILRCSPDRGSSAEATLGLVVHAGKSHHADDLASVLNDVTVTTTSVSVPMSAGHVVHVRLGFRREITHEEVTAALATNPRIRLHDADEELDTAAISRKPSQLVPDGPACRYELIVRVQPTGRPQEVDAWLSLDHPAITIPETIDAIRAICGKPDGDEAKSLTDAALGITHAARPIAKDAVLR